MNIISQGLIKRRRSCFFLIAFKLTLTSIVLFSTLYPVKAYCGDQLNFLLITIDTLRSDRLSCYGSEHVKTPNIDSLASRGTLFLKAFAHTSTTLPSHTNILLGTTPLYHGVHDNLNFKVRDEYLTLAEHLKKEGYSTGAIVGAFPLDSRFGLSQGFDTYDGDFGLTTSGIVASAERSAETVIERALEWLNQCSSPWFLWIHCFDPHDPYEPPEPFKTKYSTSPYDGEVAYVDFAMKKFSQYLDSKDLFEKTVIVFTGDHGESLSEHGEMTHGYFAYNSTIWIPLFILIPGMRPQIVHQNVSHIDLFPTICDTLKIEKPPFLQGISLIPIIKGKKQGKRTIYFESLLPYYDLGWAPIRGIIQDKYKFIDSPIPELYNLKKDFNETRNIVQKNNLDVYRKHMNQIIKNQEFRERTKAKQGMNRETLERLKSLGYVGDYLGEKKKTFMTEDDVKVLLPYHYKSVEALKLWNEGKVEEGIQLLKEVITEKKAISTAYSNLASIYRSQGKLNDAIQVLQMGIESIPESYKIFSSYVDCLTEADQWNEIISVFERMTFKQLEFDPVIWNSVGRAYSNIGDFEKALMLCERAILIDKKYSLSYSNLGHIYFNIFNLRMNSQALQKAIMNYKKAIELDSKISAAHDGLGLIHMYNGNYDEAIHHLRTALQLQPDLDHTLYNLGIAYLKKGNKTEALSYFNRFKSTLSYGKLISMEKENLEKYIIECKDTP